MLGGETDDLVRNAGDDGQQNNTRGEAGPERRVGDQHVEGDRYQHHRHQEASAAARMEGGILLDFRSRQWIAILECEDRLVLGAVIFVNAADIFPERNAPDKQQEQGEADYAVDQVEDDASAERGVVLFEFRCGQQRNVLIHEDEEGDRDNDVDGGEPGADRGGLLGGFGLGWFRLAFLWRDRRGGCLSVVA